MYALIAPKYVQYNCGIISIKVMKHACRMVLQQRFQIPVSLPLCHSAPRKTQLCMQFAFASVPKAHIEKEGVGLENVSVNLVLKIILLFLLKS